jgi:endonuclease/exonuclease/phosphatase (EEP) superfamily protein YafD
MLILSGTAGGGDTFTVATLNVNAGISSPSDAIAAIRESAADIVLLQEPNPRLVSGLTNALAATYPYRTFTGPEHKLPYYIDRLGILSRYPLESRFLPPAAEGAFGSQIAVVHLGDFDIQLANVHLEPPALPRATQPFRSLRGFRESEDRKLRELKALFAELRPDLPTIVAGDFNALTGSPTIAAMLGRGMTDTHASLADAAPAGTWHEVIDGVPLSARIDYVFCDRTFTPVRTAVIPCPSSDHSLALTELRFNRPMDGTATQAQKPRSRSSTRLPKDVEDALVEKLVRVSSIRDAERDLRSEVWDKYMMALLTLIEHDRERREQLLHDVLLTQMPEVEGASGSRASRTEHCPSMSPYSAARRPHSAPGRRRLRSTPSSRSTTGEAQGRRASLAVRG